MHNETTTAAVAAATTTTSATDNIGDDDNNNDNVCSIMRPQHKGEISLGCLLDLNFQNWV